MAILRFVNTGNKHESLICIDAFFRRKGIASIFRGNNMYNYPPHNNRGSSGATGQTRNVDSPSQN